MKKIQLNFKVTGNRFLEERAIYGYVFHAFKGENQPKKLFWCDLIYLQLYMKLVGPTVVAGTHEFVRCDWVLCLI